MRFIIILCLPLFVFSGQESTKATRLNQVEFGLKANREFITVLNATVSNYGDEKDRKIFRRVIQHHIFSDILYHQFDLDNSYAELKRAQNLMILVYDRVLKKNRNYLHSVFMNMGPDVIRGENRKAKSYLYLGLRELRAADQKKIRSDNTRYRLQTAKLNLLQESLKILKQSGKYAVLLGLILRSDYEVYPENTDFESVRREVFSAMRPLLGTYGLIHFDNFYKIYKDEDVFYNVWKSPELQELESPLEDIDPPVKRD